MAKKRSGKNKPRNRTHEQSVKRMFDNKEFVERFEFNLARRDNDASQAEPDPCTVVLAFWDTVDQVEEAWRSFAA